MLIYIIISAILTLGYVWLMVFYSWNWWRLKETIIPENIAPKTKVSIIIPARDEAQNIGNILGDLLRQNYPPHLMEIIIIDDHSTDDTPHIVKQFDDKRIKLVYLKDLLPADSITSVYKKRAIEAAVNIAEGTLIFITDADCRIPETWVNGLTAIYETSHPKMMAAPVIFTNDKTLFEKFQALDFIGMMAITGAFIRKGIFNMCNGANLVYEKSAFIEVGGYKGIDQKASGDDMFLIYKMAQRFPGEIKFVKNLDVTVSTYPLHSLRAFIQQRFRWTSKSGNYQDKRITFNLAWVYLCNWTLLINPILYFCGYREILFLMIPQLILKVLSDFVILYLATRYFKRKDLLEVFIPSQVMHLLYIVIIGTLGNILPYNWKGRKLN